MQVDGAEAAISFPENSAIEKFLNFASSPSAANLADVKIVTAKDAKLFRCHRIVLAAQSEFFARMLREVDDDGEVTIIVPDVDASVIEAAYRYGTIHLNIACQFYLTFSHLSSVPGRGLLRRGVGRVSCRVVPSWAAGKRPQDCASIREYWDSGGEKSEEDEPESVRQISTGKCRP